MYEICKDEDLFTSDLRVDIRDKTELLNAVKALNPDFVFHMAAQPLVSDSYRDPIGTIETNVTGTLNLLNSTQELESLFGQVIITTDKVYKNIGSTVGYLEGDPLGGRDIYSASKAAADILTQSFTASFNCVPTAIARSGNVIGGGDHSKERLLPDLIRSFSGQAPLIIRNPEAIRPWQHVLDCLWGYYLLSENVLESPAEHLPNSTWNFGPDPQGFIKVDEIVKYSLAKSHAAIEIQTVSEPPFHEAMVLTLNSSKARNELGWRDQLEYPESIDWTLEWHKRVEAGEKPVLVTQSQISEYLKKVH
jgi:CDP-glucose 4,6-dehydratase